MTIQDYDAVDKLMQHLHKLHFEARPDLYVDKAHPYSLEEFEEKVMNDKCICLVAEEDGEVVGICFVKLADKSLMDGISYDDKLEISMYPRGIPGYTFTPHVAADGTLSWTNNGGLTNPAEVKIDAEKAEKWLSNGAQPTETVKSLLKKSGIVK